MAQQQPQCYKCQQYGHYAGQCPLKKKNQNQNITSLNKQINNYNRSTMTVNKELKYNNKSNIETLKANIDYENSQQTTMNSQMSASNNPVTNNISSNNKSNDISTTAITGSNNHPILNTENIIPSDITKQYKLAQCAECTTPLIPLWIVENENFIIVEWSCVQCKISTKYKQIRVTNDNNNYINNDINDISNNINQLKESFESITIETRNIYDKIKNLTQNMKETQTSQSSRADVEKPNSNTEEKNNSDMDTRYIISSIPHTLSNNENIKQTNIKSNADITTKIAAHIETDNDKNTNNANSSNECTNNQSNTVVITNKYHMAENRGWYFGTYTPSIANTAISDQIQQESEFNN